MARSTNTVTSYSIIIPHHKCNIGLSNQAASRMLMVCGAVPSYFFFVVVVSLCCCSGVIRPFVSPIWCCSSVPMHPPVLLLRSAHLLHMMMMLRLLLNTPASAWPPECAVVVGCGVGCSLQCTAASIVVVVVVAVYCSGTVVVLLLVLWLLHVGSFVSTVTAALVLLLACFSRYCEGSFSSILFTVDRNIKKVSLHINYYSSRGSPHVHGHQHHNLTTPSPAAVILGRGVIRKNL